MDIEFVDDGCELTQLELNEIKRKNLLEKRKKKIKKINNKDGKKS